MWDNAMIERYSRQILVREIDFAGSERLLASEVTVGGEGVGPVWLRHYLAGAGISVIEADRPILQVGPRPLRVESRGDQGFWLVEGEGESEWPGSPAAAMVAGARLGVFIIRQLSQAEGAGKAGWQLI